MAVKLVYFAWVRERIGTGEETREIPASVATAGDLIAWLAEQGPNYANAFSELQVIRVAIDRAHVSHDTPIGEAREIALFPPVTGG